MSKSVSLGSIKSAYLKAFVKLRKENSKKYPRLMALAKVAGIKHCHFYKVWPKVDDFYVEAEAYFKSKLSKNQLALLTEKGRAYDVSATKDDCINDLRRVQEEHEFDFITRTFYRNEGKYCDATWSKYFGTFKEFRRQAGLELNRHQHRLEQHVAKHAAHDIFREYYEMELLPCLNRYELRFSNERYKTVLVGSDFHDIDTDMFCLGVFIDTARRVQPDVIVLNGDIFDCYDASKYDKDIRLFKIQERFEFVKKNIFAKLREVCPNAQIDFILGNHEWRIINLLANKTPNFRVLLSDVMNLSLADVFGVHEYKINLISKVDIAAFTDRDKNNELKKNFRIYFKTFYVGHFKDPSSGLSGTSGHCHRPNTQTSTNIADGERTRRLFWVETGCMCETEADYVMGRDRWGQSFALVHIDTQNRVATPEHFIFAGDFIVIHGVRYARKESVQNNSV